MKYSRLWAHDGNNSLKCMLPVGNRTAADTRVYNDTNYFLSREYVDRFANEVKSGRKDKHREVLVEASEDEDDPGADSIEGDPTNGVQAAARDGVDQCVKNWKAAASDEKKRT